MRTFVFIFLILAIPQFILSQNVNLAWANRAGAARIDQTTSIITDPSGNVQPREPYRSCGF